MNPLKRLPKIRKRDTLGDELIIYCCKVNDGDLRQFDTKAEMYLFLQKFREEFNEIRSLEMYKLFIHTLIS